MAAAAVLSWFYSEVYLWRTVAATCWSILCAPLLISAFVFLAGLSITHPLTWIYETLSVCFSFNFLVSVIIIIIPLVFGPRFCLPHFSVTAEVDKTRLSGSLSLFRWSRLPVLVTFGLSGALCAWGLLRLMGSSINSLTYVQDTNEYTRSVLNEKYLFLVQAAIFFGVLQYVQFFLDKHYYLTFPHIQRHKIFHIQREAHRIILSSTVSSVRRTFFFYCFYFIFGGSIKLWIKDSFNINEDENRSSLNSVFGMLDLGLAWQTYVLSLVLTSTWTMSHALTRIFHTQLLEFNIQSALETKQDCGLADAMGCSESSLLQYLAFYDFSSLCLHSRPRRQELLALSQPGGHPRVWMSVSRLALHVIREMTLKVQEANRFIMSRVASQSNGSPVESTQKSFLYSPVKDIADMSVSGDNQTAQKSSTGNFASSKQSKLGLTLSNLPFLAQLMMEKVDTTSRCLFASSQMHIWAVEGLSQIACWAYTEDKYGVVQGFLPTLIYTLIDLHEAIEKHFKCIGVVRRPQSTFEESLELSLPHKLHSVTRTAIYRLIDTYRNHLDDLHLNADYGKKVQAFSEFLF